VVNDRPPAGYAPDYGTYGYDGWSTGSYPAAGTAYGDDDPLFGAMPGTLTQSQEDFPGTGTVTIHAHWQHPGEIYEGYGSDPYATGQTQSLTQTQVRTQTHTQTWDSGLFPTYSDTAVHPQVHYAPETYGYGPYGAEPPYEESHRPEAYQSGPYDEQPESGARGPEAYGAEGYVAQGYEPEAHEPEAYEPEAYEPEAYEPEAHERVSNGAPLPGLAVEADVIGGGSLIPRPRANRRRRPAKRSALLTVAVPSVAVMGVAACAAATVTATTDDSKEDATSTQADAASTHTVTTKLDQQLAGVSRDADDFASRASRTQERLDLKERQAAEKRKKAEEAARKEALRPKFMLPVTEHGLSAYFGQAGVNWMSVHTGIDFPVSYGTPVRAATDGTVRTQWNPSYGNMAIVTAADGTETWYCHLSSTKIRSGSVQAGDVIAYSGNSGNSTGPHLHFEVHPQGGAAVDPLSWLLAKGLDPR
jgi:murein DD-endopeptidase MepM/ murein hydrolase activator NlpD